jgi:Icc-related predicted phosphoesterase
MPKLAICSDLHLEFGTLELHNTENADVLILSGDICVAKHLNGDHHHDSRYRKFFKECCERFPKVVYVLGNHEHYSYDIQETTAHLKRELAYDNLHILDDETVDILGYTFIGVTLWTNMNEEDSLTLYHVSSMMSDFQSIKNSARTLNEWGKPARLTPEDTVVLHKRSLDYIDAVIKNNPNGKYIVVGHHCPSKKSIHPKYAHDKIMNGAFASDLDDFIAYRPQIRLWTHGHTHEPFDYMIGETRIVCNPRGYSGREPGADNFKLQYLEV